MVKNTPAPTVASSDGELSNHPHDHPHDHLEGLVATTSHQQGLDLASTLLAVELWEAQGEPARALELAQSHLAFGGVPHPTLLRRAFPLVQLVQLGDLAPDWVVARWMVEQAAACNAPELRLGQSIAAAAACWFYRDDPDGWAPSPERDWVRREFLLHSCGGLRHFVEGVAHPGLVARAPCVRDWIDAPMSGYQRVRRDGLLTSWVDLRTDETHTIAHIGSDHFADPLDGTVIGRIVPTCHGGIFETVPLAVPLGVAESVAAEPDRWFETLATAYRDPDDDDLTADPIGTEHDFSIVSDVPDIWLQVVLRAVADREPRPGPDGWTRWVRRATRDLVHVVVRDRAAERISWLQPGDVDLWPTVAAALLQPEVLGGLLDGTWTLPPRDLERCVQSLPEPIRSVCVRVARGDLAA